MLSFNLTIVFQMVSFLVFAWLFNLVFFRPIVAHLEARNRFLVDQQVQAQELLKAAEQLQVDHVRRVREAQQEAQRTIDSAIKAAQAKRSDELSSIQAHGRKVVEEARVKLASQHDALKAELQAEVAGMAQAITAQVVGVASRNAGQRSPEGAQA